MKKFDELIQVAEKADAGAYLMDSVNPHTILAIAEAFMKLEQENTLLKQGCENNPLVHEMIDWKERAQAAEAEVQRLNATAQMNVIEQESMKNLRWLFDLSKTCHALGIPLRLSDSQVEKIDEAFLELELRLNATPQPVSDGWVKCSERMPEYDQMVIVWAETPVTEYSKYAYWNESERQWWGDDEKQIYKVTHWMPLPAAPGGQDD